MCTLVGLAGQAAGQSRQVPNRLHAPAVQSAEGAEAGRAGRVGGPLAASLQGASLEAAIERAAARVPVVPSVASRAGAAGQSPSQAAQPRSWIRRHPALFGALVGGAAGAASSAGRWNELYCASGGDEDCLFHGGSGVLFGAGVGAGVGALIGGLAGR